jgi:hypothetical protein
MEDRGIMSDADIALLKELRFDATPIPYLHLCLTGTVDIRRETNSPKILSKYDSILHTTNGGRCLTLKNFDVSGVWDNVFESKEELLFAVRSYLEFLGLSMEYLTLDGYGVLECIQDTILHKAEESGEMYPVIIYTGAEDTLFYLTIAKYLLFFCYDTKEGTLAEYLSIRGGCFENTMIDYLSLDSAEIEKAREKYMETFDQAILDELILKDWTARS